MSVSHSPNIVKKQTAARAGAPGLRTDCKPTSAKNRQLLALISQGYLASAPEHWTYRHAQPCLALRHVLVGAYESNTYRIVLAMYRETWL